MDSHDDHRHPGAVPGDEADGARGDAGRSPGEGIQSADDSSAEAARQPWEAAGPNAVLDLAQRTFGLPQGALSLVMRHMQRVFEIGPVFRAEPSFTSRHATEFTGIDADRAWISDVDDVMRFEERMLAHAITAVAARHGDTIAGVYGTEVTVSAVPFPRVTMASALEIMRARGWDPQHQRQDLDPEGERGIAAHIAKETGHEFVFLTDFPASVRPFYHMRPAGQT
jgi:aspartyl/asparaginyl-tRNA synthetase